MKPQLFRQDVWEGADVRLMAEVEDSARKLIQVQDVEHVSIRLFPSWDAKEAIGQWAPAYQDVVFDSPQTFEDDPAWPYSDSGYNFRWTLPADCLAEGRRQYRVEILFRMTDRRRASVVWSLVTKERRAD